MGKPSLARRWFVLATAALGRRDVHYHALRANAIHSGKEAVRRSGGGLPGLDALPADTVPIRR